MVGRPGHYYSYEVLDLRNPVYAYQSQAECIAKAIESTTIILLLFTDVHFVMRGLRWQQYQNKKKEKKRKEYRVVNPPTLKYKMTGAGGKGIT